MSLTGPVRWRDLSSTTISALFEAGVLNGCGGKGSWLRPPSWLSFASCDQHDFNYWIGGDEAARALADRQFYDASLEDVRGFCWWRRPLARVRALAYYIAVRLFGNPFFRHGVEREWQDLHEELENA